MHFNQLKASRHLAVYGRYVLSRSNSKEKCREKRKSVLLVEIDFITVHIRGRGRQ